MHILMLNWKDIRNPHVGGAEIVAFEFAKRLVKEGHTVTFFSRSFPNALPHEVYEGVDIIRRGNKLGVYFQAFFYYRSLRTRPDIVLDMVNTICWQTPLYVPAHKRIVYVNQLAKKVLFYELPFPLSYIAYFFERFEYLTYKHTHALCFSNSTKADLIQFNLPARNIDVFSMGLNHTRYTVSQEKKKTPLFIFVGRLVRMKQADLCVKAMKIVTKRYPQAQLAILGNGPEEQSLSQLIQKLELEKHILFVNKQTFSTDIKEDERKAILMGQAWALILPSIKEGWGMVVTEAAACGTPSIVTNVTGLRDSVIHNKTGLIIPADATEVELAEAMIKIIANTSLRTRLSKEAIQWSKQFNWDKSYAEFKHYLLKHYEQK